MSRRTLELNLNWAFDKLGNPMKLNGVPLYSWHTQFHYSLVFNFVFLDMILFLYVSFIPTKARLKQQCFPKLLKILGIFSFGK